MCLKLPVGGRGTTRRACQCCSAVWCSDENKSYTIHRAHVGSLLGEGKGEGDRRDSSGARESETDMIGACAQGEL